MPSTPHFFSAFFFSGLFTLLIAELYRRYAIKSGIIDTPNHRSSHTQPTPRGGGVSIVVSHTLLIAYTTYIELLPIEVATPLLMGCLIVAITGFTDDYRSLSSRVRFCLHLSASFITLYLLPTLPTLPLGTYEVEFSGLGLILIAIGITWLVNLYNFMDGIDGIATTEATTVLFGAAIILTLNGSNADLLVLLIAPLLGFLAFNIPPAKLFMGDGCSGYLGMLIALLAIITSSTDAINLWSWIILLAIFITDSSWTLLTRIFTGQRWQEAHRSHTYQILSRKQQSHGRVTSGVLLINLFWLTPMAWLASDHEAYSLLLVVIAYLPLAILCIKQKAGLNNE